MATKQRKPKVRWPALSGVLATVGGVVVAVAHDPTVIASAAGKLGVSVTLVGGIFAALVRPLIREEHER